MVWRSTLAMMSKMVAGQVDCGDGAGWCKISMGWSMIEYAHVACGLGSMFQGHGDDGLEVDTCDDVEDGGRSG